MGVFLQGAQGQFRKQPLVPIYTSLTLHILVVDVNEDGKPDLLAEDVGNDLETPGAAAADRNETWTFNPSRSSEGGRAPGRGSAAVARATRIRGDRKAARSAPYRGSSSRRMSPSPCRQRY